MARANGADPLDSEVHTLVQKGQFDQAIDRISLALDQFPDYAYGHFLRGWLLQQLAKDGDAIDAFDRALELDRGVADWHVARGFSLIRLRRLAEAESSLRRALRHDERSVDAWFYLGAALMCLDRSVEAINCFRSVLALRAHTSASCHLADLLEADGRLAEAELAVKEALRHDPRDPTLMSHLASVVHRQGQTPEALRILRAAQARTPTDFVVLSTLVEVLVEDGQHREGLATAERLASSQPSVQAQALLGWAYLQAGSADQALEALDAALAGSEHEGPFTRAEIAGVRAGALERLGRHEEARAILDELERESPQVFAGNVALREYARRCRRPASPPG